jgi:hypothetical protein
MRRLGIVAVAVALVAALLAAYGPSVGAPPVASIELLPTPTATPAPATAATATPAPATAATATPAAATAATATPAPATAATATPAPATAATATPAPATAATATPAPATAATATPAPATAAPVATITLPAPGEAKELFAGCNFISLTFPDGTTSEEVVGTVTPPGAIDALWRQNAALDRFEGFSPAFPQASDLLTVSFLDPVWLCTPKTHGPLPAPVGGTPTPGPTPAPTPAPTSGLQADLAITGMHLQRPEGRVWIWLVNNGPNTLVNATAQLQCSLPKVTPFDDNLVAGGGFQGPISVTLTVGQVLDLSTAMTIDVSEAEWTVTCEITNESFTDPKPSNNKAAHQFWAEADLAVTDLFPQSLPTGEVYARITNNGPDSLVNAPAQLECSYTATPSGGAPWTQAFPLVPITVSLVPGETKVFDTQILVATDLVGYDVKCKLFCAYDPQKTNNTYNVTIPMSQPIY